MPLYIPKLSIYDHSFPDVSTALMEHDGLLAHGGDLSTGRVITGYKKGIFPWYEEGEPILWWSPSTRALIEPDLCHISKSMKKLIKSKRFTITINHEFEKVIRGCAEPRKTQQVTWINRDMISAYIKLHLKGVAHSVEIWEEDNLVGGLYGINLGQIFCGESMFNTVDNAAKFAFISLCKHFQKNNGKLIDCQIVTPHLKSLGVKPSTRPDYIKALNLLQQNEVSSDCWKKQKITIDL